jgi:ABC-2 type transport system permease protein
MRFLSLANRNMKEIYRDPVSILLGVAMPVILLALFVSISKNAPIPQFTVQALTPGIIVFSFSFLTMFSAILLSKDRQSALLTRLLASPLKPIGFILAYSLPFIPIALLQIIICLIVAVILGFSLNMLLFLLSLMVLIPIAFACIGVGMILGSLLTENQVAGAGSFVIIISSLFGGAWMDLNMVGGVFKNIGYALPFAHAIDATRAIYTGAALIGIASNIYWVVGYAILFLIAGIFSFSWKIKV